MPHEELVLVLLHHGPADARQALPVDAAQRVARPVVAQRDELLGVADRLGERDTAPLVAARTGEPEGRHRVALRQDQQRTRERDRAERVQQAERVRSRERDGGQLEPSATARRELDPHLARVARRQRGQRLRAHQRDLVPPDEPVPARVADLPVEPVAPRLAGLARGLELLERGPRIGRVLEQGEATLESPAIVREDDAVRRGLARRHEPREYASHAQTRPEAPAPGEGQHEQDEEEREGLVTERAVGVEPDDPRGAQRREGELAGPREPTLGPGRERRRGAEQAIREVP